MKWEVQGLRTPCHCEEGAKATDAAIHGVSRGTGEVVCSVIEGQWIATDFQPWPCQDTLCHCK
jgi:hypothetical protein